jgi:5-methylcytosine-specific restriction endonuclease McrA
MSPIRLCSGDDGRGCPNPATYRGRCAQHARTRERRTHPNRSLYNSKRWKILRRRVLFEEPLCRVCGVIATVADHIVAYEDGGPFWSRPNLQGLCDSCHSKKTNAELRARG